MTSRNQQLLTEPSATSPAASIRRSVPSARWAAPLFFAKAQGPRVQDADGKWYRLMSVPGADDPRPRPSRGAQGGGRGRRRRPFGAPTEARSKWPISSAGWFPPWTPVRLVSSGTEATMSAIRLARGYTGRDLLIKFEGCYHGHSDSLLVKAGSGR